MSTFTESAHPRAATGRFTAVTHGEPGLDLVLDPMRERLAAAVEVLEDFDDLEIMDHSPARQGTVTLGELRDPRLALGNCWAATNEVIEEAGASAFGADWVDQITVKRRRLGGQHVAILVADRHGMYVVDYTARQFSPDLPFPFVAGVKDWMAAVEKASGAKWEIDDQN
jgi:hypothetical protein